jgi:hypothetical protein
MLLTADGIWQAQLDRTPRVLGCAHGLVMADLPGE